MQSKWFYNENVMKMVDYRKAWTFFLYRNAFYMFYNKNALDFILF